MERACKILHKIASASHRIISAANEYADRKDLLNVGRAHFQLEEDMRKVSVACECLASIIPSALLSDGPAFDERIKDWLMNDEPRACYETLDRMEKLLQEDASLRTTLTGGGVIVAKDKIQEAVNLFDARRACFHFLFTSDIWNNSSDDNIRGGYSKPNQKGCNATVPGITSSVHDDHAARERRPETRANARNNMEDEAGLDEVLKWLDGLNCAEKQDATLSLRQPDTCRWLFNTTQYKMWRVGEISFLWLRGKAGAGKSVLASSLIHSLEELPRSETILAYFYCDFRNERSTQAAEVMRSVLFQLLCQLRRKRISFENFVDDMIKLKERGGATLKDAKQLAVLAFRAAGLSDQKPLVVVDALDECKNLPDLLQALLVIKGRVQLFVTSRPLHAIIDDLSGLPFISMYDIADHLSADIELHVTRELDARQRLRDLDMEFKTEICSVLCNKADGMFRWVQCSIDTLNRCVTRKEVRNTLNSLPEGLDGTYERILLAIDMNTREGQLAQRALVWLVAALRPLRLNELMEGLSINLHTRTLDSGLRPMHNGALLDACGSLVTYIDKRDIIFLSHFSVKEYLMGEIARSKLSRYYVNWELAHLHLVRSCICYISICLKSALHPGHSNTTSASNLAVSLERQTHVIFQPLRDYVFDHALDHLNHLGPRIQLVLHDIKALERSIETYSGVWDNMCLSAIQKMSCTTPCWPTSRHDLTLYILVALGPNSVLRAFLRRSGFRPKEGTNPLVYAAYFNKHEHAKSLLSHGARLDHRGWHPIRFFHILPIEVAFQYDQCDIATLFMAEGSPVPLQAFAMLPQSLFIPSLAVKTMLQTDDFAESANDPLKALVLRSFADYFLDYAAEEDLIAIIRRIIQVSSGSVANFCREMFLRISIGRGDVAIARYLLSLDSTLPADWLIAIQQVGMRDSAQILRLLLEHGASALARARNGDSVLHTVLGAFAERDALEAARLLVAHGCDPLEVNYLKETPLDMSIKRGHVSVAHYLLSLNPPLPSILVDTLGLMKLQNGAQMVACLLENGASALECTSEGNSLLHEVLKLFPEHDALEAAQLLVSHTCDPLRANSNGKTPVAIAIKRGHVSVTRYLLSLGATLPSDSEFLSTLQWEYMLNGAQMMYFLVEKGASIPTHSRCGDSVLHIAIAKSDEHCALQTAKLLVSRGYDPLQPNSRGQTPLQIALERGYVSIARYLLSVGTPLPSALFTSFYACCGFHGAQMLRCLMENGANILSRTHDGDSALHIVLAACAEHDALEGAKLLIAHGCDPFEGDSRGRTPLRIAVERGHVSVASYILSLGVPLSSSLLVTACTQGISNAVQVIHCLLENGADASALTGGGDSLLHIVIAGFREREVLEAVKLLVTHGCDPLRTNPRGHTPLCVAVHQGHVSVARYLLSLGATFPSDLLDVPTLKMSGVWNNVPMMCCLVENGAVSLADASSEDSQAVLHNAMEHLQNEDEVLETAKFLLAHGCDLLGADSNGTTPIRLAIKNGYVTVARYFLSLGIPLPFDALFIVLDVPRILQPRGSLGWQLEMIPFLIDHGADVRARRQNGDSMLHAAVLIDTDSAIWLITLLVECGCDPVASNTDGATPLHVAVKRGNTVIVNHLLSLNVPLPKDILFAATASNHMFRDRLIPEVIEVLVAAGCEILVRNEAGHTPIHVAIAKGHVGVVDYLLAAVGNVPSEEFLAAGELAPEYVRGKMMAMLRSRRARSEGPIDGPDLPSVTRAKCS